MFPLDIAMIFLLCQMTGHLPVVRSYAKKENGAASHGLLTAVKEVHVKETKASRKSCLSKAKMFVENVGRHYFFLIIVKLADKKNTKNQ